MIFTKESFIALVDVLREQYDKDCAFSKKMGDLLNSKDIPPYDWDKVNRYLITQVQLMFPPNAEGFCEFEHYCYELNFGRDNDGVVVLTAEDLWEKLNVK